MACSTTIKIENSEDIEKKEQELSEKEKTDLIKEDKIILKEENEKEVMLGIDLLESKEFSLLKGKKIGLITNQTGVNSRLESTIDILSEESSVTLVALFGPEHGVRGDIEGGKSVEFYIDQKTNLPVYSLYGKNRKPTDEMLDGIDALVYDIQDIGVRSYTFISTMGLAIEAASENKIEFIVLDRPNPLGGIKVEGNLVEDEFISFISQFKIPYVYGLTCGELAQLLVGENMIDISNDFAITVVPMKNWNRAMRWEDTGLEWIPTSPHIPQSITSIFYPMTGILGELRSCISIGVGYTLPFQLIGAEWIKPNDLATHLTNMNIPGLTFRPITFKPYYAFGEQISLKGVQIHVIDYSRTNLIKTQFYIIDALKQLYPGKNLFDMANKNEIKMFNRAIGSREIYKIIDNDLPFDSLLNFIDKDVENFKTISNKYHLYE